MAILVAGCASRAPTVDRPPRSHGPLTGTQYRYAVGGAAVLSTSSSSVDQHGVHGVLITVDAATGDECLLSVQTGTVTPDRGATVLFTH